MIGMAYVSVFQYFDKRANNMGFKQRPVLIIGKADSSDYIVLPISRVTNSANLDPYYDVELLPSQFPLMSLTQTSYIRTHKQSVVNSAALTKMILDFKETYSEKYLEVLVKVEEFQKNMIGNAI
ncbi:MAG: hypothetical protein IJ796_01290 [Lachnospiraceae bacterium]|nr:hypothetical protein [Lachnospiraceae bacterium]